LIAVGIGVSPSQARDTFISSGLWITAASYGLHRRGIAGCPPRRRWVPGQVCDLGRRATRDRKEALGYWFVRSGLIQGDYCLYATHRPVSDLLRDMKGVGIGADRVPEWIASSGSPIKCDLRDSTAISFNVKEAAHRNKQRRIRIATDVLSPLLVLNPLESMYGYWS